MLAKDRGHSLAVLQALPRHRHEKLYRRLRRNFAFANLLLDGLRQKLHQCQPPRHPTHTPIEPPRQLLQTEAESLFQFLQQPTQFQRGFLFRKAQ